MAAARRFWTKEDDASRNIAMPNEMIGDLVKWREEGLLKSPLHQEFAYSYYWLIAYLWRYAKYTEFEISQKALKKMLGYSEIEKRMNYIISRNGLLDKMRYTESIKDFPVGWTLISDGELDFLMWSDLDEEDQKTLKHFKTNNYIVKLPAKSMGSKSEKGLFWHPYNSHMMSGEVFKICMENKNLSCAGFYLFGILIYMRDLNRDYHKSETIQCPNKVLTELTGWSEQRLTRITNELQEQKLITKEQTHKGKGNVNNYTVKM